VKAGSGLAGEAASDSAGVSSAFAGETLVAPLDDEKGFDAVVEKHRGQIAAVIIEPMPANFGLLKQRQEFLEHIAKACKANGIILIFDEVISGFRVAPGGMAELTKITPDLVTYGKVIGGGFPVGCYGGKKELMDLVAPMGPVYQAGTLSANPVGMRAGLATLKKSESVGVHAILEERATKFSDRLRSGFEKIGSALKVERQGSVFWLHEAPGAIRRLEDIPKTQGPKFKDIFHACARNGVYLAPSGFEVGFIGLAHTDAILTEAADLIIQSVKEVTTNG
ncbi:MAG TPA: aminotransferase class III-fold pyridoxal phosphate-dependent enzyme, partial [Bdellovibrionales bacterium]|nr:aminotransferase class III-fold pyridoxal phosphate-dependent enzyme [Bdellovibrionales bacterium]